MRLLGMVCGLVAAALVAAPAWSQVKPGSETGTGLVGADAPAQLRAIEADPYRPPAEPACRTIPEEIQAISKLVGPDFQSQTVAKEESWTDTGAGVARSLVPYGGVVRYFTGADKKDEALKRAIAAGFARRGFLRGVALHMTCGAPAAPAAKPKPKK